MIEIPNRLLINGRAKVERFELTEPLYLRFSSAHFQADTRLPVAAIRFPKFSVNRGAFSQPSDVLIPHWILWGILRLLVSEIPQSLPVEGQAQRTITFKVEHDPIGQDHPCFASPNQGFENYAHSEVCAYENERPLQQHVPHSVKKKFRLIISDNGNIQPLLEALAV